LNIRPRRKLGKIQPACSHRGHRRRRRGCLRCASLPSPPTRARKARHSDPFEHCHLLLCCSSLCSLDRRIVIGQHGGPLPDPEGRSHRSARQPDRPAGVASGALVESGGEECHGEGGGGRRCHHSRDPRRIRSGGAHHRRAA
jgi:hypothetical protein